MNMKTWVMEKYLALRGLKRAVGKVSGMLQDDLFPTGRLQATVIRADGQKEELGLISTQMVDTTGVTYLAALLAGGTANTMYYHGTGTGTTAAAITDTALGTEVGTRATGTHTSSTNVYTSVGLVSYTGTYAITEQGIFSASTAGTLLDRSVFAAINVVSGDSIQFTYTLTLPAGG